MPLYKRITVDPHTKVLIWKIEESFEDLSRGISLTPHCEARVENTRSDIHRRGFMSVRHLLAEAGYTDQDLVYDENGKPHLRDGKHISITHSFGFSGIIISEEEVGIDIEMQREKILRIANKFTQLEEYRTLANTAAVIRKLTIVWGAKEAIYKLYARPGVSFLQHIDIQDFDFDSGETTGKVYFNNVTSSYKLWFLEFEDFTCVYALPENPQF